MRWFAFLGCLNVGAGVNLLHRYPPEFETGSAILATLSIAFGIFLCFMELRHND